MKRATPKHVFVYKEAGKKLFGSAGSSGLVDEKLQLVKVPADVSAGFPNDMVSQRASLNKLHCRPGQPSMPSQMD